MTIERHATQMHLYMTPKSSAPPDVVIVFAVLTSRHR
jgi:hypothetical protein